SEGALARCDGLLLSSHARLLVVLPLAKLFQETLFLALSLEATDGAVDRLVLPDANPGHAQYLPPFRRTGCDVETPRKTHWRHPRPSPPRGGGAVLDFSSHGLCIRPLPPNTAWRAPPRGRPRGPPPGGPLGFL